MSEKITCPGCGRTGRNLHDQSQVSYRCGGCGFTWPRHMGDLKQQLAKEKEEGRAEAQAHIKVLEASGAELAALLAEIFNPMPLEWKEKVDASIASRVSEAMFCQGYALVFSKWYKQNELRTSPTEALDKVVREAKEYMRERCAKVCEEQATCLLPTGAFFGERCAEAIRRIEP